MQQTQSKETHGPKPIEWIAGLFEGEGCLTYKTTSDAWELKIKMTDSDVMWDLYIALSCRGTLESMRKYPSDPKKSKPHQTWRANKRDLIFEICTELYPYMGNRRREKFQEFFTWYQNKIK